MKLPDKILITLFAATFIVVYIVADFSFEMITDYNSLSYKITIYIISLLIAAYFCLKYFDRQKAQSYGYMLFCSVGLWVCLLSTADKISLLYHAAVNVTTTTTVKVESVKKSFTKSSFTGSKVFIKYVNRDMEFKSSCTNYFALTGKDSIRVDIGAGGAGNYYISKIYLKDGELSAARHTYLNYWFKSKWYVPVIIFVVGPLALFVSYLRRKSGTQPVAEQATERSFPLFIFKLVCILFGVFLLLYLLLLGYLYIHYGACNPCALPK
jgi:hypothetical protein